jgi:hypothetical protein
MMTRRTDAEENSAELNELQSTIERLSGQVRCLTMAVDELTTELHWRNNQRAVALLSRCGQSQQPLFAAGVDHDT